MSMVAHPKPVRKAISPDIVAARRQRLEAAKREAESYTIYRVNEDTLYVLNPSTGRVSTITRAHGTVSCDCPDHRARCAALGIPCKHIAAASLVKTRYTLPPRPKPNVETEAERLAAERAERERKAAEFDRIFGP